MAVPLIDILAEEEALPPSELERLVELRRQRGGTLAEWIVRSKLVSDEDLFFMMSRRMGVPAIPEERLLHLTLSPEIRRRVPLGLAQSCVALPLDLDVERGLLSVAMFDPSDAEVLDRLRQASRVASIRTYLARRQTILDVLRGLYPADEGVPPGPPEPLPGPPPGPAVPIPEKRPVEAIRGKVEIDADLAEEIALLGEAEEADLYATAVKHIDEIVPKGPSATGNSGPQPVIATPTAIEGPDDDDADQQEPWEERTEVVGRADDTDETVLPDEAPPPLPDDPLERPSGGYRVRAPYNLGGEAARARSRARREATRIDEAQTTVAVQYEPDGEEPIYSVDDLEWIPDEDEVVTGDQLAPGGPLAVDSVTSGPMRQLATTARGEPPPPLSLSAGPPSDFEPLMGELFAGVGVLVSMLEERIDPGAAVSREHARLARLVTRELGHDGLTVNRVTVAAHLFGLDISLRAELGSERAHTVAEAFAGKPLKPGGLNPSLRSLGARAIALAEGANSPVAAEVIRTVADYLDLRAESDEESSETLVQLLRAGSADPVVLDALVRVLEEEETLVETRRSKVPT